MAGSAFTRRWILTSGSGGRGSAGMGVPGSGVSKEGASWADAIGRWIFETMPGNGMCAPQRKSGGWSMGGLDSGVIQLGFGFGMLVYERWISARRVATAVAGSWSHLAQYSGTKICRSTAWKASPTKSSVPLR